MSSELIVDEADGVVSIALARPERGNALNSSLVVHLRSAVDAAIGDPRTHTVVIRGDGQHFCTGFDLAEAADASDGDLLLLFVNIEELLARIYTAPMRTVAYAQGRAWGAGADLFAACKERVCDPSATFRFPGAQFGLALGTRRLAQRIGPDDAVEIVASGKTLDSSQALACGLASEGVDVPYDLWLKTLSPPVVDPATLRLLFGTVADDHADSDLASLVRSAMRPGLKERIAGYRKASRQPPAAK